MLGGIRKMKCFLGVWFDLLCDYFRGYIFILLFLCEIYVTNGEKQEWNGKVLYPGF